MTATTPLRLYELVMANGRPTSPYAWRTRYALAHKRLPFETVGLSFTDIPAALGGRFKTVPILEHGETAVVDSWAIAEYLDRAFPDSPPLFGSTGEREVIRLTDAWLSSEVMRRMFAVYVIDIYQSVHARDREYYRSSRERFLGGATIEAFVADRASKVPAIRTALEPLRTQLKRSAFLGGSTPSYADYIALGNFLWVASVSTLPLLASNDTVLRDWIERCLDLHDGAGRVPDMRPLFE